MEHKSLKRSAQSMGDEIKEAEQIQVERKPAKRPRSSLHMEQDRSGGNTDVNFSMDVTESIRLFGEDHADHQGTKIAAAPYVPLYSHNFFCISL